MINTIQEVLEFVMENDVKFSDALSCADNFLTFKSVVKATTSRNGLFASFMPKPILEESGSGLHVNLSLSQNGFNIFKDTDEIFSKAAEGFMAGSLSKAIKLPDGSEFV